MYSSSTRWVSTSLRTLRAEHIFISIHIILCVNRKGYCRRTGSCFHVPGTQLNRSTKIENQCFNRLDSFQMLHNTTWIECREDQAIYSSMCDSACKFPLPCYCLCWARSTQRTHYSSTKHNEEFLSVNLRPLVFIPSILKPLTAQRKVENWFPLLCSKFHVSSLRRYFLMFNNCFDLDLDCLGYGALRYSLCPQCYLKVWQFWPQRCIVVQIIHCYCWTVSLWYHMTRLCIRL